MNRALRRSDLAPGIGSRRRTRGDFAGSRPTGPLPRKSKADRACPAGVPRSGLAFGDGHHSCPGEYLALHESEIFLVELLSREVTLVQEPRIEFNEVARAYHLADFLITVR